MWNRGYKSFLEQNGSYLSSKSYLNDEFFHYEFFAEFGKGSTTIYFVGDYANICIADHIYYEDFEYTVESEDSIAIQQYDSIDSDHAKPHGNVFSGMQYIDCTKKFDVYNYVIKKNIPAKVIGIQIDPPSYEKYLRNTSGAIFNLMDELQKIPREIYLPQISFIFNQIRNFKGNVLSQKLFYKSKVDEIISIILDKTDAGKVSQKAVSVTDYQTILTLMEYLGQNLDKNISLNFLAGKAYMSPAKFKYVFKNVTKSSFTEYFLEKKMELACTLLLQSNLHISEIAARVGYKNPNSFTIQFKKYMGITPLNFRKK